MRREREKERALVDVDIVIIITPIPPPPNPQAPNHSPNHHPTTPHTHPIPPQTPSRVATVFSAPDTPAKTRLFALAFTPSFQEGAMVHEAAALREVAVLHDALDRRVSEGVGGCGLDGCNVYWTHPSPPPQPHHPHHTTPTTTMPKHTPIPAGGRPRQGGDARDLLPPAPGRPPHGPLRRPLPTRPGRARRRCVRSRSSSVGVFWVLGWMMEEEEE